MTFEEKALYHQIHPLKLATDIIGTFPSLYLLWQHELLWGLLVTFIPSIIASYLLIRYANLEPYKQSAFGQYIRRYMSHTIEAVRLLGLGVMMVGAWYHLGWLIALGLVIILVGWLRGILFPQLKGEQLWH